jgi:anionic cell wall polymer biosynthesis LytR-Cps2A-Psr (LCP) family protein
MNVGEGTNEERINRQRAYLESVLKEGETKVRTSARYYYRIFEEMESFAVTNLTGKQISRIAKALTQNEFRGFFSFEGKTESSDEYLGDGLMHAEFYPSQKSIKSVLTDIFGLVYDPEGVYDGNA